MLADVEVWRRALVGSGGVAAATGSVRDSSQMGQLEPFRRVRKALKMGMIAEGSTLTEKFRRARRAGFDGVELDSPGPYTTEDVSAYRTFQRDCLKKAKLVKTKVKLTITIYYREIRTWRLTCDWAGQS